MTRTLRTTTVRSLVLVLAALGVPMAAPAQDSNILTPVDSLERWLLHGDFDILDMRSRFEGDRTSRVAMDFGDGNMLVVKWARAPDNGDAFNNSPRYEVAAYEAQKLFLEPHEYVVPPTVMRAFDLDWYRTVEPDVDPTFDDTESVLVVLQYWLFGIAGDDFWHPDRLESDTAYARAMGNFNAFTYIISHNDENQGNYLISESAEDPRIFSVDNGLAFESDVSDQGAGWRRLRVDAIPEETVHRLRSLTEADVRRQLETLAQFRIEPDGALTLVPPEPAIDPGRGIRETDTMIQLGLDERELRGVWRRIQRLLERVEKGDLRTIPAPAPSPPASVGADGEL